MPNTKNTLCACGFVINDPLTGMEKSLVMVMGFEIVNPALTMPP